ncbi:cytochrome BD ubiquinol oxidase subunit I [Infirmifilum uzonense]|uniref:Cytochrome BD ubiquinol oxidase subunit I n=1 Tax=Infirmifilum uzonense TaxID=1550241 RepID=A0A0F7FHX2_9CREN|nr:cytochrome ubiquinol oxidase subunit I [Infirmifilum uzonense]AKG38344.1 cytochrome BD ubiquinol oxidase subunit I [Infirmifilum uzonense]
MDLLSQWLSYPASIDRILSIIGIEIHWFILQYVLGLPLVILLALLAYKRTGKTNYEKIARTATKALGLIFAVGAASGTASEFGLVVIWPNLLEAAGRYIYFPLYLEIFAFLTEIVFIYLLVFAWSKLSLNARIAIAFLALFGAWFSAAMIVSVNSYMVAPTGIAPAFDQQKGWLYQQGYPKVLLVLPSQIASALDVSKLLPLEVEVVGEVKEGVAVYVPSRIVARLAYEAWSGVTLRDSVLAGFLKPGIQLPAEKILVKDLVDSILLATVEHVGYTSVTFLSPVYPGSILHSIGAGITTTAFTILGAYALLLLKKRSEYYETGLRFGVILSLIAIIVQGAIFGHVMGEEIAHYNPEKLAAMEGQSSSIMSIPRTFGIENLMKIIIYGRPDAQLPDYDLIPPGYCVLGGAPPISDCRPPLLIHYLYYVKTGLAVLLGLFAIVMFVLVYKNTKINTSLLVLAALSPILAQLVSFLGWAVREIGRKPWSIYGVMTVDVAHTANPASPSAYILVAFIFLAALSLLIYAAYRILYLPSLRGDQ